jgi:hypothetical protein
LTAQALSINLNTGSLHLNLNHAMAAIIAVFEAVRFPPALSNSTEKSRVALSNVYPPLQLCSLETLAIYEETHLPATSGEVPVRSCIRNPFGSV